MKSKKILIAFLLVLFCTLNLEAKDNGMKNDLSKTTILPIEVYLEETKSKLKFSSSCDDVYNWQVSIALDILQYNLSYPPNYANIEYYDMVWSQFNASVSMAGMQRKSCKSVSAN